MPKKYIYVAYTAFHVNTDVQQGTNDVIYRDSDVQQGTNDIIYRDSDMELDIKIVMDNNMALMCYKTNAYGIRLMMA